ncbi:MAG: hypothetical protein GY851_05080 [bacterium]|nr:hypothetical protein [bacterium]
MRTFRCGVIGLILAGPFTVAAEPARTYYDEGRLGAMRDNLERYEWAREEKAGILERADRWLGYDDQRLRTLVPPPGTPRAVVAHVAGAPVEGDALNRKGRYSWIVDFDLPWKVTSPIDGAVYPSNDYAGFLASGCADRTLLTGPYADDGWGCMVEGYDKPFWFVGVYAHWSVVRLLLPAIEDLSKAYLITEEPRYAHACAVLLWQLAEYYPDYYYEKQSRYAKEIKPDYVGRLLYHTWESLYTCQTVPPAYDAICPAIDGDVALRELTGLGGPGLRARIEERLLVTMATDIMDGSGRIAGNYGMHQVALLRIAATLAHRTALPTRQTMVDWVVGTNPGAESYVALGLEDAINNLVYRDGHPFENPGYNTHWCLAIGEMLGELGDDGAPLLAMPRVRNLFTWPIRMAMLGKFSPAYGDGGNIWNGVIGWDKRVMVSGYRFYRDPAMAKALVTHYGNAEVSRDLFEESIEEAMETAANELTEPVGTRSELMPGVGFGSLQANNNGNRAGVATLYGDYWGHRHYDLLNLDVFALFSDGSGYSLLPDLGYPETADTWDPRRYGFLSHTICHNTVMVNQTRQEIRRGRLHLYDRGPFVKVIEASAEKAYEDVTDIYRRTLLLIDAGPDNAYAVDIFRVRGGTQHDWLIHGTDAAFSSGLALTMPRKEGTLAGPGVEYGVFYDDARYANDNEAHEPYTTYRGSGFQWLFNVQEAPLEGVGHVMWNRGPVYLKAHFVGSAEDSETVFACDGIPQRRKPYPDTIKFVVRRRQGDTLESVFVTVFEPYKDTPFVRSVKTRAVEAKGGDMPVALEVDLGGRRHLIFNRLEGEAGSRSPFSEAEGSRDARVIVLQTTSGAAEKSYYLDPCPGVAGAVEGCLTAQVTSVDCERGIVSLDKPVLDDGGPAGGIALVESDLHTNAVPVATVLDASAFSVGDDDLYAGKVHVDETKSHDIAFVPKQAWFLEAGMTVVNEAGDAVARITETVVGSGRATLSHEVSLDDFPDRDGDGRRSCKVVVVGPGDRVILHRVERMIPEEPTG